MAAIFPFRALRPSPESASRVAAVPYDVVNREEAAALVSGNPLSFLHVSRAEIDLPPHTDPYGDEVYTTAAQNFDRLKVEAPLVEEREPSVYFYRLRMGAHEQTGLAACYSIDEYDRDVIKKHERTRRDKEDDRTRHMIALRAQTGPVFLTYRASADLDRAAARAASAPPLFDFVAVDGVRHTVWRVSGADTAPIVEAVRRVPALYIADGHHRAASAARTRERLAANGAGIPVHAAGVHEHDTLLAVAFPDDQVQILPYNRVVKDLAGRSPESFLAEVRSAFPVTAGEPQPSRPGEVSMYLDGRWYSIALGAAAPGETGAASAALDVSVLQERVIAPMLGVGDVRTDKRIDFVGGARGAGELERLVRSGKAALAFAMFPVTLNDLMTIADQGGIMPPKSTWFEPKLRDGLLSHVI